MKILEKQITPEIKLVIEVVKGDMQIGFEGNFAGSSFNVKGGVDSDYLLDELAKKIPGQIDDAVIAVIKAALNNME